MRVGCAAMFSPASPSPRICSPSAVGDASLANLQPEAALSAAALVDMQSAHTLAGMADKLTATGIKFHAVEPRSSVRDRLRHEQVDAKLGSVDRFTTVADVIDHFLVNRSLQQLRSNPSPRIKEIASRAMKRG